MSSGCTFAVGLATIVVHDQAKRGEQKRDTQCEETPSHHRSPSVGNTVMYIIIAAPWTKLGESVRRNQFANAIRLCRGRREPAQDS